MGSARALASRGRVRSRCRCSSRADQEITRTAQELVPSSSSEGAAGPPVEGGTTAMMGGARNGHARTRETRAQAEQKAKTGIAGLDQATGGGLPRERTTLVFG